MLQKQLGSDTSCCDSLPFDFARIYGARFIKTARPLSEMPHSPGPIALSPHTDALHFCRLILFGDTQAYIATAAIGVWINKASGETEQPPTETRARNTRDGASGLQIFCSAKLTPLELPRGRNRYLLPQ